MITITDGEWIADLGTMTCRHVQNKIEVSFELNGKVLQGKIKYIPIALMDRWARARYGERMIQQAVFDAQEVFMRAYFERELEGNGIRE